MENIQIQLKHFETVDLDASLSKLSPARSAAFNYYDNNERQSHCTQGTRLEILSELQKWIQNPTGEPTLWLHGMAGTGKSTIARTVAKALNSTISLMDGNRLPNNISLGATFFFKRDDDTRNSAIVLFRTLAYQLAYQRPDLKSQISDAIKQSRNHNIQDQSPMAQWDTLILEPLKSLQKELSSALRIILIIDALDECQNNNRAIEQIFRQSLPGIKKLSQIEVRFLITSRRESHIDTAFKSLPNDFYRLIELPKVPLNKHNQMGNDISIFLKSQLSNNDMNRNGSFEWPNQDDFRKLVERTGGLFMYAATACKFLDVKPKTRAKNRLKLLLSGNTNKDSPESALNDIYRKVLSPYTQGLDEFDQQEDDPFKEIKEVLRVIVMLYKPLPTCSLAEFTPSKMGVSDVEEELEDLRPVVDLPDDPRGSVNLVHLSFREFLLDEEKCRGTGFLVQPSTMHFPLFRRCLEIMSDDLHEDICGLQKPGTLSVDVPPDLVQKHISPHLQYACRYWIDHLLTVWESPQAQGALIDGGIIHMFLQKHILNWLEVLGLTKEVVTVSHLVSRVNTLANKREYPELSKLIYDAHRFILFNRRVVEDTPLQVYYSAVFFSPNKSIIKSLFRKSLDQWIAKSPVVDEGWGVELMILEGHNDNIVSIEISQDNQTIATATHWELRVWEVATGIETAQFPIPGNTKKIALSPDGQIVALTFYFKPGLQLHDLRTDEIYLLGQTSELFGVVFNQSIEMVALPIPRHVYATSFDLVLYIWTVKTGELMTSSSFTFDSRVGSIKFSPTATSLALISETAIAIYDIESNNILHYEPTPSSDFGYLVDWKTQTDSADDMKVDNQAATSTAVVRKVKKHVKSLRAATFFPNGKAVAHAVGSTIRINDVIHDETDDTQPSDIFRVSDISVVTRDHALIVSGRQESHFELLDLKKLEVQRKFTRDLRGAICKNSSNGKVVVTRIWDRKLPDNCLIWNITTGEQIGQFKDVNKVQFSPDGEFLALAFESGVLRILETLTLRKRVEFDINQSGIGTVEFLANNKVIMWTSIIKQEETVWKNFFFLGNMETGQCFYQKECNLLKISPDRMVVAFLPRGEERRVFLLQADTGDIKVKLLLEEHTDSVMELALFSPDGTQFAIPTGRIVSLNVDLWDMTTDISKIKFWDTTTGESTKTLKIDSEYRRIGNIAISPDGKVAISTTKSGVMVWDPSINKWSSPIGHSIRSQSKLSFSEDGKYLNGSKGCVPSSSSVKDYNCLYVDNDWVLQGGEKLLWLPPAYRGQEDLSLVKGGTIIMRGCDSIPAIFIKVDLEKTPLAKLKEALLQVEQKSQIHIGTEVGQGGNY
ncbi:hypothetical protein F4806DRAFT_497897 [Annulohypoxylon nitens]|nr:hypothetical protein F4806DRAFT_497897 [Annulohypoxylon nitens]